MTRVGVRRMGFALLWLLSAVSFVGLGAGSWLYALEGTFRQETWYTYHLDLTPVSRRFDVTLPLIQDVDQPWYRVRVLEQSITSDVPPRSQYEEADPWGWPNVWSVLSWTTDAPSLHIARRVRAVSDALYGPIRTIDPYPLSSSELPLTAYDQLLSTPLIQSDDPAIVAAAADAVEGALTQLDAVVRILGTVRETVRYACGRDLCDPVLRVDAVATLEKGVGNCVCYAHLAMALLRAAGIPAAYANGFVADRESSHAGHAWIAVHFPSWGWVEFESSDWMPAYGEAPTSFLMPQHLTAYVADERGISREVVHERHEASFTVLDRPEERTTLEGAVEPGEAVAWVLTLEFRDGEEQVVSLDLEDVPDGWGVALSDTQLPFVPDGAPSHSVDVLLTVCPKGSSDDVRSFDVVARSGGHEVGRVTVALSIAP